MLKRLARTELFRLVWLEPVSTLAPRLNVSDAKLKKACAEAHIPLPGRIYWAKRRAGQAPAQTNLPIRPAGMSEDVILGGTSLSWLQTLSDPEILQWPVDPPQFPEDIAIVRDRVRRELGRVEVPTTWDGAHSEVRRLKRTDAGRQERERRTSVMFSWEAPRFDSALGQRQLRILNAIFLGVARVGGKGQVGGGDRLETSIVAHGTAVAFKLTRVALEAKTSKPIPDHTDRLRLSILDVHGANPERIAWGDSEQVTLETLITDIAVELITTAEINYRDACTRRHLWVSEKREALQKRLGEERASAEAAARDRDLAIGRARTENLLGMATDYRQARTIRLFVSAMRRRFHEGSGMVTQADFDGWCDWALAQADDLDPVRKLRELLLSGQVAL